MRRKDFIRPLINCIGAVCFSLSMLFWSAPSAFSDETPAIQDITVVGLRSISVNELLYLLDIEKGKPLNRRQLSLGIKRAFLKGIFDDIVVEGLDPQDTHIEIIVRERSIVRVIDISGNRHFSTGFIRRNISLKKGERFNANKLQQSIPELKELISNKGYPSCSVSYSVTEPHNGKVTVSIEVNEGEPLIVKDIKISGGSEDEKSDLLKRLRISAGDVFDRTLLDQSLEKIKSSYKKKDYVETKTTYSFDNGTLDISFDPGRRLTMVFDGNSSVSSSSLKKEIPFYELDEFSDDLLEETVARIVGLYHSEGFPDAQIAPVLTANDRNIEVKFYIHEGERFRVDKISFEGSNLPADKLKNIIQLQAGGYYNPDLVASDNDSIREFYHSLGYLYVSLQEPEIETKDSKVGITFRLTEGIQVKISEIIIKESKTLTPDDILKNIPLKKGNPYNEVDILDSRIKIQNLYRNKGYLDASVAVEREISNDKSTVTFNINEGEEYLFGKDVIIGNVDTKRQVITRSLLHKEDEPFDYSLLLGERQRLYRTGLFSNVEAVPWEKTDHIRDVLYRVEEGNAGAVEFGAGYGEYEKFRGFLDVSYKNLFGMNRQLSFRTEMSTLNQRFILQYFEPWFLGQDLAFRSQISHEYKKELNIDTRDINYRLKRETATAGVEKKLSDKIKGELYYEFSFVRTYDVQPDIILSREDTGTLVISGLRTGFIYDSRDNPVNPRSGILGGVTYKVATALLFSETDFNKIQLYANKYTALGKNVVLAVSIRGGAAKGFSKTSELPLVERFFLGGRTTVRGYAQDTLGPKGADNNPTGGNAFLMGNLEFRFDIWKGFGLVAFVDTGNVWQKVEQASPGDLKYTTGLGLRYNTPVGPLSIDYGYKLNREKGESKGEIHFSVGQSF